PHGPPAAAPAQQQRRSAAGAGALGAELAARPRSAFVSPGSRPVVTPVALCSPLASIEPTGVARSKDPSGRGWTPGGHARERPWRSAPLWASIRSRENATAPLSRRRRGGSAELVLQ